jgi:hypothetical protein
MPDTCKDCIYSFPNDEKSINCRRYPPTITRVDGQQVTSHNPLLLDSWWCGEFKRKRKERPNTE